jgi:SAM-dependent methyltransferase
MFDRNARVVFDQAATAYDNARPGYPSRLIVKLIELTQLPAHARILEIGCGTGQITQPLASRGFEIVAVELGENLARIATANLERYTRVRVIHSAFEEWAYDEKPFDLVLSAQAFHWIDPEIGYPKIRRLLKDQGHRFIANWMRHIGIIFPSKISRMHLGHFRRTWQERWQVSATATCFKNPLFGITRGSRPILQIDI